MPPILPTLAQPSGDTNIGALQASLRRAREIEATLKGFKRELLADDGHYSVHVTLPEGDRGILAVLNALEAYVRECGDGPARIEYEGRSYTLEAAPAND
jgi:hypothetical protein